jgi:sterol 14-demethylase
MTASRTLAESTAAGYRSPPVVSGARPGVGHYDEFCATPIEFMHRAYAECGELAEFDLAGQRTILMVGPEAQEAFFKAPEDQLNAAAAYQMMVPVFGEGIQFGAEPHIERQQLRIQYQGLRFEKMAGYAGVVAQEVEDFIRGWGDAGEFDFYDAFTDLTMKTSTHCLLGSHLRYRLTSEFADLYRDLEHGLDPAALRDPYSQKEAYTRRDKARVRLQELITEAVRDRRAAQSADGGITSNDMLQIYMDARYEDGSALTEHEITGMVIWFMFAGHHTSSNTAAWTLLEMCRHPQYWDELHAEVDGLYAREKQLSINAQRDFPLIEGFVRESLRLHPPLNVLTRRVLYDFDYKDVHIAAGTNVMVCPHVSHRLAEVYPNPEVFDPKRPPPDNPYAAVAFGGGRHKCIGNAFALLQVRTIFCALLHSYDFELTDPPESYTEIMPTLILRPSSPTRVRYRRRRH